MNTPSERTARSVVMLAAKRKILILHVRQKAAPPHVFVLAVSMPRVGPAPDILDLVRATARTRTLANLILRKDNGSCTGDGKSSGGDGSDVAGTRTGTYLGERALFPPTAGLL